MFVKTKLLFAATLLLVTAPVLAQPKNQQRGQRPPDRARIPSAQNPLLEANQMKEPVSLPDVPEFTGKARFKFGIRHDAQKGPNYIEKFVTKEDPTLVIDWYKNTLNTYKWKIKFSDKNNVLAKKDGNTCSVMVMNVAGQAGLAPGERTQIEINYFQQNKR